MDIAELTRRLGRPEEDQSLVASWANMAMDAEISEAEARDLVRIWADDQQRIANGG